VCCSSLSCGESKLNLTTSSIFSRFPSGLASCFISESTLIIFIVRFKDDFSAINSTLDVWSINDVSSFDFEYEVTVFTSELIFLSNCDLRSLISFHGAWFSYIHSFFLVIHASITSSLDLINVFTTFSNMLEEVFVDSFNSLFQSLFFFLKKLLFVSLLLVFSSSITSKFLCNFEILFSFELSVEDLSHDFFLFVCCFIESLAQLHNRNCTLRITNSCQILVDGNGGQWAITDLLTVSYFILTIVKVPHIEESIYTGQVEKTTSLWRPATRSQVRGMISSLHDWRLQVFVPDFSSPVTNRHEVLGVSGITPDWVNWSMMLTRLITKTSGDIGLLSLVCHDDVTLFTSDQVIKWTCFSKILHRSSTKDFFSHFTVGVWDIINDLVWFWR